MAFTDKPFFKTLRFAGRLMLQDPVLVGENFQSLINMRYKGFNPREKTVQGIAGMSKINSTAITDNPHMQNGYHFKKEQPAESHILLQGVTGGDANPKIFENITVPPGTGDFVGGATPTSLYTEDTAAGIARFSDAPNGHVAMCDGIDACIWGGVESIVRAVITSTATITTALTNPKDYTDVLRNTLDSSAQVATFDTTDQDWLVGSTRPLKGIKYYVSSANTVDATLSCKYWKNDSSWAAVSNPSDGTIGVAGKTLSATGTFSFDSTESDAAPKYFEGYYLYWYNFTIATAGAPTADISHVTLDAPFQKIRDLWNGAYRSVESYQVFENAGSNYKDYTTNIFHDEFTFTGSTLDKNSYANLDSLATTDPQYFGFSDRMTGIIIKLPPDEVNSSAVVLTVKYWNGSAWTTVGTISDGTDNGGDTFSKTGVILWNALAEGIEFKTQIGDEQPLYYYQFTIDSAFDASTGVYFAAGIPVQKTIHSYKFPIFSRNRIMLCSRQDQDKNSILVGAANATGVFNGDDSVEVFFGDDKELSGGGPLFSRLGSSLYDVTLVMKKHAMFGWTVENDEGFVKPYNISNSIGIVAPDSFATTEMYPPKAAPRPIAVWQADGGIYMFDNTTPINVSGDIERFWDKNQTSNFNKLHASYIHLSQGWIDHDNLEYHWSFADASSSGLLNREWVLDLRRLTWYEVTRCEKLAFTSGGTTEIAIGDTITGDTSGSTALVMHVELSSGTWAGGDAAGNFYLRNQSAAFQSENLNSNLATIAADSLKYRLQCAFETQDNIGNKYQYGCLDTGFMYQLENGNIMDTGNPICQEVQFGDFLPVEDAMMHKTQVTRHKHVCVDTDTAKTILVKHYADGKAAESSPGVTAVDPTASGQRIADVNEKVNLVVNGAIFHSLKYICNTDDKPSGYQPLMTGLKFQPVGEDVD